MRFASRILIMAFSGLALGFSMLACGGDGNGIDLDEGRILITVTADGVNQAAVTLNLFEPGGTSPLSTATTFQDGTASFDGVDPGEYEVEVVPPTGFELAEGELARKAVNVTEGGTAEVSFALTEEDGSQVVEIMLTSSFTFSPSQVNISPGTTVRWVNQADIFHTITPDEHDEWSRTTMNQAGQTFEHTFQTAGTFPYFCEPHLSQGMTGTITVQ
ncbi:MAG: plastocyanin/azurin family copper-binding protein [Gemmatimonadota bacterium]